MEIILLSLEKLQDPLSCFSGLCVIAYMIPKQWQCRNRAHGNSHNVTRLADKFTQQRT